MITDINELDLNKTYSYADYLTWMFQDRLELFRGKIFKMSPAPSMYHQKVSRDLTIILGNKFKNHSCNLFVAPFDVRLLDSKKSKKDSDVYTVVQPDLCVVCDEAKLDARGAIGAPDLIVEILSPGNSKKEMTYKYDLYQEAGVLEYWMINPDDKTMLVYVLKNGIFEGQKPLIEESIVKSPLFPQLDFTLSEIFN
ncbi:Uma2 family endonuclease [Flavobacterium sp.]|jgi:Uma2 family endonuclease|uniref:Uma2 family endonuclease n=1 Tax=Flavobacterium sp. TaxID=239 RepID=UPI0037C170DD